MQKILTANFAQSALAAQISAEASSVAITSGTGVKFPEPSVDEIFKAVIFNITNASFAGYFEIINVLSRDGDIFDSVLRNQEDSNAPVAGWPSGSTIVCDVTGGTIDAIIDAINALLETLEPIEFDGTTDEDDIYWHNTTTLAVNHNRGITSGLDFLIKRTDCNPHERYEPTRIYESTDGNTVLLDFGVELVGTYELTITTGRGGVSSGGDGESHAAVTLDATATAGGLSLTDQEINFQAATNAQPGYATAAQITAVEASAAKTSLITVTEATNLDTMRARVNDLDAAVVLRGAWDASAGTFPGGGTAQAGDSWIVSVGGTVNGIVFVAYDRIVAIIDNASTSLYVTNWLKLDYSDVVSSVAGKTGAVSLAIGDIFNLVESLAAKAASDHNHSTGTQTFESVIIGTSRLTPEAHGNQSGTLSASLTTYQAHSLTVTGNLAITTTNWPAGVYQEAIYIIQNGGAYTLTIDGLSFPGLKSSGWDVVKIAKIHGTSDVMGGMNNDLGVLE